MKTASKTFPVSTTASDPVTGEVFTSQYDIFTVGAGYLDILAALNNTDVASGAALSPAAVCNAPTGTVSLVNGSSVIWGTSVVWGAGQPTSEAIGVAVNGEN